MRRPPEVVQTSAMDCGPVALAVWLGAHGLAADVDALRDVCATGVDGTSVDDLEEVACALGLAAEQVVVPWEQLVAASERYLPAIVLTLTPDRYVHFVVAWRIVGGRVDLVDPAVGRRRVRLAAFAAEVLTHELIAPAEGWSEYAESEDARVALVARLRAAGRSADAAEREVAAAVARGPVAGVGALLGALAEDRRAPVEDGGVDEDGHPVVRVRGAVVVRAPPCVADVPVDAPQHEDGDVPVRLRRVLSGEGRSPLHELRSLLRAERLGVWWVGALAALTGAAGVGEALAARSVLDAGTGEGRLLLLAGVVLLALCVAALASRGALAVGRRLERDVRERLLARVARLGDRYVRSRPPGDLAERGHAVVLVRVAVELG
ncbi:MAG: cysteine peptidase family C39 domain-containing protein [Actinomycetota bacterium]|nr:cysteine peptidase family C39 domain-containing protein [Actinomycetota bacterium]